MLKPRLPDFDEEQKTKTPSNLYIHLFSLFQRMNLFSEKNSRSIKWYSLLAVTITTSFSYLLLTGGLLSSPAQFQSLISSSDHEHISALFQGLQEKVSSPLTTLGIPSAEATSTEPEQQQEYSLYENPQFGFSIEYPNDWRVNEGNSSGAGVAAAFTSPLESDFDTFAENFAIGIQNLPNGTSLDDYGRSAVALLQSEPGFELVQSPTAATFGDLPAQEIEYTLEIPDERGRNIGATNTTIQGLQVWTISNGSAYVLSFASEQDEFSRHLPAIEQIINSFRLTNSAQ